MEKTIVQNRKPLSIILAGVSVCMMAACTPTVQIQAPDKPIEINLNVNIEHHVKVEIQKDVRKAMAKNKDIF
jgi:uncharacterized lipoprotein YajG